MTPPSPPSDRARVRRIPERARYDAEAIRAIVDAAYVCHVAFVDDSGVHCIPTACWREADQLYVHGSNGSRMLKALSGGGEACVTITHVDGLVLARSAFNHSMNYRSLVVHGRFELVPPEEKAASLDRFLDHLAPGRHREVRPGNRNELAATSVLRIPLAESSAKIRSGGPEDDEADLALDVWAGELPIAQRREPPRPDGARVPPPDYVRAWKDEPPPDPAA